MSGDIASAARLVSYAAAPRALPAREPAYADLVDRYLADPAFAEIVEDVAVGLGLEVHVDKVAGVMAIADSDGFFRRRLGDMVKVAAGRSTNETRVLFALALLAVARIAFPNAADLVNAYYATRIDERDAVALLDRLVEEIAAGAEDAVADQVEAEEAWRAWAHLRTVRSGYERQSAKDKAGLVRKVCSLLEDEGHLIRQGDDRSGMTWRTTPRFRFAVHTLVTDSQVVPALRHLPAAADLVPSGDADPSEILP